MALVSREMVRLRARLRWSQRAASREIEHVLTGRRSVEVSADSAPEWLAHAYLSMLSERERETFRSALVILLTTEDRTGRAAEFGDLVALARHIQLVSTSSSFVQGEVWRAVHRHAAAGEPVTGLLGLLAEQGAIRGVDYWTAAVRRFGPTVALAALSGVLRADPSSALSWIQTHPSTVRRRLLSAKLKAITASVGAASVAYFFENSASPQFQREAREWTRKLGIELPRAHGDSGYGTPTIAQTAAFRAWAQKVVAAPDGNPLHEFDNAPDGVVERWARSA
jgi:hypothetical protein